MPRTHKANKRAASRRRHFPAGSHRPSPNVTAMQSVPPVSATPTQTRAVASTHPLPMKGLLAMAPAPNSVHRDNAQDQRDRRAHPDQAALKERAFALACIGHRSPAIAAQLGVSERTIRHWNHTTVRDLALEASRVSPDLDPTAGPDASAPSDAAAPDTDLMEYHRALAIERQLDIAVTARAAYDRLMAQHDHLLAQFTATCDANIAAAAAVLTGSDEASAAPILPAGVASMARLIPQLAASASRQLQLAQAAHREAARLQGVPTYAHTDARLCAEQDYRLALQTSDPAEEQGGHVPVHVFDPKAALEAICGPLDDEDDDDPATSAPTQNAPSSPAATSPAKTATSPGNISGNDFGNNSGNGSSHLLAKLQPSPQSSPRAPFT